MIESIRSPGKKNRNTGARESKPRQFTASITVIGGLLKAAKDTLMNLLENVRRYGT